MIDYDECEDITLQKLASEGDRTAEEALAKRYMCLVRACARPLFLAGGDSEDLIQEGVFGLLAAIRQFSPEYNASFKTFARQCVKNRLYEAVRRASSPKHSPLNEGMPLETLLSDEPQTTVSYEELIKISPEEHVLARENERLTKELFLSLYDRLSKLEKQVYVYYLNGFSYKDIALRCGKNEKAVDNAIQRIRNKLAECLRSGDDS